MVREALRLWASLLLVGLLSLPCQGGFDESVTPATAGTVPQIVGLSAKDAKAALLARGPTPKFTVGPPAPRGTAAQTVRGVEPAVGTRLKPGAIVEITLYGGPAGGVTGVPVSPAPDRPAVGLKAPDVTGMTSKDAKAAILTLGVIPKFHMGPPAPAPEKGLTIYEQNPPAGTSLAPGQTIRLLVYSRFEASAAPAARVAPDLTRVSSRPFLDLSNETIEPRSGRIALAVTDLAAPAGALKIEVTRTWVAAGQSGMLGSGWRLNWERRLTRSSTGVTLEEGPRAIVFAPGKNSATFRSDAGDELRYENGGAIWRRPDRIQETFDKLGRLIERDERNGNKFTLTYDSAGRLARIAGPAGSWLSFSLDESGRATRAESSSGDVVQYGYGEAGRASASQDGELSNLTYVYDASGALVRIEHPRFGATEFTYDRRRRIRTRKWADGAGESYAYDDAARSLDYTDPAGQVTKTEWSADGRFATLTSPLGVKSLFEYDGAGRTVSTTGPTGQTARFVYDAVGRTSLIENASIGATRFDYDGDTTQITAMTLPDGRRQSMSYDPQGNLVRLTDSLDPSQNATFSYFPDGQPRTTETDSGQKQTFAYDGAGRKTSVTDSQGNIWRYEYDERGRLVRETDPAGGVTAQSYDADDRLASTTESNGRTTRYAYEQRGRFFSITTTDARGGVTRSTYDQRGRLNSVKDAAGGTTRYSYDPAGRLISLTEPGGQSRRYEYNSAGQLVAATDALGAVTKNAYDAMGNLTRIVTPTGAAAQYQYSPAGRLTKSMDVAGLTTFYDYDPRGRLVAQTDPAQRTVQYEYTAAGRPSRVIPPIGPIVSYQYDDRGNLAGVRRGDQQVARYEYDALGQRIKETRAGGLELTFRYDALGKVVGWQDSQGAGETIDRDLAGRAVAIKDASGGSTRHTYDPADNLLSTTDPLGHTRTLAYDLVDRLVEVTEPAGDRARYEYTVDGKLAAAHFPGGGSATCQYDLAGNLVNTTTPACAQCKFTYDAAGRVVSLTDAKGQTTGFSYDESGRLQEKRLADGKVARWTYDGQSRVARIDDGEFPVVYGYDDDGHVTRIQYPVLKRTLAWEYNDAGLKVRFVDSEGRAARYQYDEFDRLVTISFDDGSATTFAYDSKGRTTSIVWPNGVKGTWQFDALDRAVRLTYVDRSGKPIAGWTYKYDAAGNRIETVLDDGQTQRYGYDANNQLVEETVGKGPAVRYSYLPGGNRAKMQSPAGAIDYRYNEADQLLAVGKEAFRYDENGNLVERRNSAGLTTYVYDTENRLIAVKLPDGAQVAYRYAPTGERIARSDATGTTYYITDGVNLVAELDGGLKSQATYLHGPNIDQPLVMSRAGKIWCLHADRLGSISRLSDSQGNVAGGYEYDAFGQLQTDKAGPINPFTYTAREFDAATGLYYYRARYYDPRMGRFLSKDPLGGSFTQPLSFNAYAYVLNNPLRYVDPMGTAPKVLPPSTPVYHYGPSTAIDAIADSRTILTGTKGHTLGTVHFTTLPPTSVKPGNIGLDASQMGKAVRVTAGSLEAGGYTLHPNPNPNFPEGTAWVAKPPPGQDLKLPPDVSKIPGYRGSSAPGLNRNRGGFIGGGGRSLSVPPGVRAVPGTPTPWRDIGKTGLLALDIGLSASHIINAQDKLHAINEVAMGHAGGSIGAVIGGGLLGPFGAVGGGVIGGLIGTALVNPTEQGPPVYLPPETVPFDTLSSVPASSTTAGTPVLVPDGPAPSSFPELTTPGLSAGAKRPADDPPAEPAPAAPPVAALAPSDPWADLPPPQSLLPGWDDLPGIPSLLGDLPPVDNSGSDEDFARRAKELWGNGDFDRRAAGIDNQLRTNAAAAAAAAAAGSGSGYGQPTGPSDAELIGRAIGEILRSQQPSPHQMQPRHRR